jgi:trans-aconitate methyltransferase
VTSDATKDSSVWQGREYAPHAEHHRAHDDWFIARHPPSPSDVVLDAGCGTGEFTAHLGELVPTGRVIGVEPDSSMLEQARANTRPNVEFRAGRVQQLDEICDAASVDLVVSRAVFHWIPIAEYERCYTAILRVLKPNGWFHAESGGAGNVRRVVALMNEIATAQGLAPSGVAFPDAGTVMELLEQAGFVLDEGAVTTVAQRRRFDRQQLIGFVRTQAALAYVGGAEPDVRDTFVRSVEDRLDELRRHDGSYDQTFVRLHVLCRRPA